MTSSAFFVGVGMCHLHRCDCEVYDEVVNPKVDGLT